MQKLSQMFLILRKASRDLARTFIVRSEVGLDTGFGEDLVTLGLGLCLAFPELGGALELRRRKWARKARSAFATPFKKGQIRLATHLGLAKLSHVHLVRAVGVTEGT